ncbi:MAG: hypothetical protein HYU36_00305 [Planctomycetes bacterium]|nr:hypothetical protein [Planctomycetota bacterium]
MRPRFLLDNDGSNIFHNALADGADLQAIVEETVQECAPEVTTYLLCSNAGNCYFPTRVGRVDPRAKGLVAALAQGHDLFGMLLQAIKKSGRETFITMRMNDVHNPTDQDEWNTPPIRKKFPDAIVGPEEIKAGKAAWMSYCMDYSRAEVREYYLTLIRELASLYGSIIDGIQLDWMRFPRHLSGDSERIWQRRAALTEFTASARRILREAGQHLQLAARVPPTLEGCRSIGMDLAEWTRLGLVDFLVACPFLTTNWHIPIQDFRAQMGSQPVPIYAGFDFGYDLTCHHPESLRGVASCLYDCGADGLYLFNFPCWTEYLAARPYHWLRGLDRPETAGVRPIQLAVSNKVHRHEITDGPGELPAVLPAAGSLDLRIYVPRSALPAGRVLFLTHSHGDIHLAVNGQRAEPFRFNPDANSGGHRSEIFLEFVDQYFRKESRPKPLDCRLFKVRPACLCTGFNTLHVENSGGQTLEIERLHLALW